MGSKKKVLVISNSGGGAPVTNLLGGCAAAAFEPVEVRDLAEAARILERESIAIAVLEIDSSASTPGSAAIAEVRDLNADLPIVVLVAASDLGLALAAVEAGAQDYLVTDQVTVDLLSRVLRYSLEKAAVAKALKDTEQRHRRMCENVTTAIYELDLSGELVSVNRAMVEMFEFDSEQELISVDARHALFVRPEDRDRWFETLRRTGKLAKQRKSMKTRHGRRIELLDTAYLVRDASGTPIGYQGSATDVTEFCELSQQLSYEASHDALTSLVNRREFERQLKQVIDDAAQGRTAHALCYVDLDQFKVINDTCGHAAGDDLLRRLSELIKLGTSDQDTLARLGGDEFALLLRDREIDEAAVIAKKLLETVRAFRFEWGDRVFDVGASIGVVPIDESTMSLDDVLGAADAACYVAKDKGRNRVHVYEPGGRTISRRMSEMHLVVETKHALSENRMKLFYQPICSLPLAPEKEIRFEVLIRMQDSDGKLISPGTFLPAMERYNLSPTIDRWVFRSIIEWLADAPEVLAALDHCGVNLSGLSIGDAKFLEFMCGVLDEYRVPGHKICFEITETAAIQNLGAAQRLISTLKDRGCRFALDDFGSGLSSFGYLKNLPVDFLKIDGMFIRTLTRDRTDRAIVKAIRDVAHAMGLLTVAEFVEDAATLNVVSEIGIDLAQGYALGHPKPVDELLQIAVAATNNYYAAG